MFFCMNMECLLITRLRGAILCRYDAAPNGQKPYRQKDGALLAVGALSDKLRETEPYKSQLEQMLVHHVYPEFNSPVGHLRAKVCGELCHIFHHVEVKYMCMFAPVFLLIILCRNIKISTRPLIVIGMFVFYVLQECRQHGFQGSMQVLLL